MSSCPNAPMKLRLSTVEAQAFRAAQHGPAPKVVSCPGAPRKPDLSPEEAQALREAQHGPALPVDPCPGAPRKRQYPPEQAQALREALHGPALPVDPCPGAPKKLRRRDVVKPRFDNYYAYRYYIGDLTKVKLGQTYDDDLRRRAMLKSTIRRYNF